MISAKQLAILLLLLFLVFPAGAAMSQQSDPEQVSTDPTESAVAKDKKKEKKMLEINETFLVSLGLDLLAVMLIIVFIYYPNYHKRDYIFTFIMFNIVILLLTFVLKYVKLSIGAAFGLFAVFSILRYRTLAISMKDLTYLFIFIAMGVISAIQLEYYELTVLLAIIFTGTFILDSNLIVKREQCQSVLYENIEMIKAGNTKALIDDLRQRTGLNIQRITIGKIDYLKDSAVIKIFYHE
jgi:hypothetical protein